MRDTYFEIDLSALRHNFSTLRNLTEKNTKIIAVVKADAYGHGMIEISRELVATGVDMLAVAFCFEGIALREAGIDLPILVMGGINPKQLSNLIRFNLTPLIGNLPLLSSLEETAPKGFKVHLNLDTGMTRLGISPQEGYNVVKNLKQNSRLVLSGIMTHFAESEIVNSEYSRKQLEIFLSFLKTTQLSNNIIIHCANSGAIINMKDSLFHAVRPGIMLYGYLPSVQLSNKVDICPIGSLKSKIIDIKNVKKNTSIGYGRTFKTNRDRQISLLPIGYADGFPRILSNISSVIINGKKAAITGTISMDTITVDTTEIDDLTCGDTAILIGKDNCVSASFLAEQANTIPYEILTSITSRVPRMYINRNVSIKE